jgi:hypothetical protein
MQEMPNTAAESAFLRNGSAVQPQAAGSSTGKHLELSALANQGEAHVDIMTVKRSCEQQHGPRQRTQTSNEFIVSVAVDGSG